VQGESVKNNTKGGLSKKNPCSLSVSQSVSLQNFFRISKRGLDYIIKDYVFEGAMTSFYLS